MWIDLHFGTWFMLFTHCLECLLKVLSVAATMCCFVLLCSHINSSSEVLTKSVYNPFGICGMTSETFNIYCAIYNPLNIDGERLPHQQCPNIGSKCYTRYWQTQSNNYLSDYRVNVLDAVIYLSNHLHACYYP